MSSAGAIGRETTQDALPAERGLQGNTASAWQPRPHIPARLWRNSSTGPRSPF